MNKYFQRLLLYIFDSEVHSRGPTFSKCTFFCTAFLKSSGISNLDTNSYDLKLRFEICKFWVFNVTFLCQK